MASSDGRRFAANRALPAAMIVGGLAGFIGVALDVVYRGQLERWDRPIHVYFHEHAQPALLLACAMFSGLGELAVIVALGLVVGILLAARKRWRSLGVWGLALAGSGILDPTLKHIFRVPRPGQFSFYIFKADAGYSFPSGHTMAVSIAAGALALVVLRIFPLRPAGRWTVGLAAVLLSIMEAFALLYIGVHYLTDVLGALAISAAWIGAMRCLLPSALPVRHTEPAALARDSAAAVRRN